MGAVNTSVDKCNLFGSSYKSPGVKKSIYRFVKILGFDSSGVVFYKFVERPHFRRGSRSRQVF